jgi:hypothetical protein
MGFDGTLESKRSRLGVAAGSTRDRAAQTLEEGIEPPVLRLDLICGVLQLIAEFSFNRFHGLLCFLRMESTQQLGSARIASILLSPTLVRPRSRPASDLQPLQGMCRHLAAHSVADPVLAAAHRGIGPSEDGA